MFFFFKNPATTEIYPLSQHDALPIFGHRAKTIELHTARQGQRRRGRGGRWKLGTWNFAFLVGTRDTRRRSLYRAKRSEEHTSELQSQSNLVCRLLLEKKKKT